MAILIRPHKKIPEGSPPELKNTAVNCYYYLTKSLSKSRVNTPIG